MHSLVKRLEQAEHMIAPREEALTIELSWYGAEEVLSEVPQGEVVSEEVLRTGVRIKYRVYQEKKG